MLRHSSAAEFLIPVVPTATNPDSLITSLSNSVVGFCLVHPVLLLVASLAVYSVMVQLLLDLVGSILCWLLGLFESNGCAGGKRVYSVAALL